MKSALTLALLSGLLCTPLGAAPKSSIRGVRLGDSLAQVQARLGNDFERTGRDRIAYESADGGHCEISFQENRVICVCVGLESGRRQKPGWISLQLDAKSSIRYGDPRSHVESKLGKPDEVFTILTTGCSYRKRHLIVSYDQGRVVALALARNAEPPPL